LLFLEKFTVSETHFSKEIEGLGNSITEEVVVLLKEDIRIVVELGKVLSVLRVEKEDYMIRKIGNFILI